MTYSSVILADSPPLLFYKLGENTGTSMVDSSGNGHNGAYTSPTWAGASIPGDAAANSLSAGRGVTTGLTAPSTGFAIAWFKTTDASGTDMCILNAYGLKVGFNSGQMRFIRDTTSNTWGNTAANPVTPNDGNWHMVLMAWTSNLLGIWIDNQQCNAASSTFINALTGTVGVGTIDGTVSNATFTGMADVSVFGAALVNAKVERYYSFGSNAYNVYACNDVVESNGLWGLSTVIPGSNNIIPCLRAASAPEIISSLNVGLTDGYPYVVEFNGTGISLYANCTDTSQVRYSIDGAADAQATAPGSTGIQAVVIVSGLSAGRHVLQFQPSGNWYVARVIVVGGSGQLYSIARTQGFLASSISGGDKGQGASPITSYGAWNRGVSNFFISQYYGGTLEFTFNGSGVDMLCTHDSTREFYQVVLDGNGAAPSFMPAGYAGSSSNINMYLPMIVPPTSGVHNVQWLNYGGSTLGRNFASIRVNNGVISSAAATSGQKTISLVSIPANFVAGAWLRIGVTGLHEVNQIAAIAGNVLTLLNNLANTYPSGTQVAGYSDPVGSISPATLTPISWGQVAGMGDSIEVGKGYLVSGSPYGGSGVPPGPSSTYTDIDNRNSFLKRLAALLGGQYISLAIQGTTTAQMATRGSTDYALYVSGTAGVIVLLGGTNDVNGSVPVGTFTTNYQTMITQAIAKVASPANVICVLVFSPLGDSLTAYNAAIVSLAASNGCRTLDPVAQAGMNLSVYNSSTNPTGDMVDTLHPSPTGHQKLANALFGMLVLPTNMSGSGFLLSSPYNGGF